MKLRSRGREKTEEVRVSLKKILGDPKAHKGTPQVSRGHTEDISVSGDDKESKLQTHVQMYSIT